MNTILFDLTSIKNSKSIFLYALRLLKELNLNNASNVFVLVPFEQYESLSNELVNLKLIKYPKESKIISMIPYIRGIIRRMKLYLYLKNKNYNTVFFFSLNFVNNFVLSGVNKVIVVHDIRPIKEFTASFSSLFRILMIDKMFVKYIKHVFYEHMSSADKIIAISNYTKNDIIKYFPDIDISKIVVVYNSVSLHGITPEPINNIKPGYVLFVNTLTPYKNVATLIKAFSLLIKERKELKLVVVGRSTHYWEHDMLALISKLNIVNNVIHVDYCSDNNLKWLYENALLFVSPSFHEGFGYTPIEAAICGSPVVTSLSEALPEVTCGKLFYYSPTSSETDLYKIMESILDNYPSKEYLNDISDYFINKYSPYRQMNNVVSLLNNLSFNL